MCYIFISYTLETDCPKIITHHFSRQGGVPLPNIAQKFIHEFLHHHER